MFKRLTKIQERLKDSCHVKVEHTSISGPWQALIETEQNNFPYWLRFDGASPKLALDKLELYLAGKLTDHAKMQRAPSVFLKT